MERTNINVSEAMPRCKSRLASRKAAEKITKMFASKKTQRRKKILEPRKYATKITETSKKTKKLNMINSDQKLLKQCSVSLVNILKYPGERVDCTIRELNLTMRATHRYFKHEPNVCNMLAMCVDLNTHVKAMNKKKNR